MKIFQVLKITICIMLFYGCQQNEIHSTQQNNDTWEMKAPMKINRALHSMAAAQGKLYVFGGATGGSNEFKFTSSVEMYDPAFNQWSAKMDMPKISILSCAVPVNDKIYILGGEDGDSLKKSADLLVYDCTRDSWSKKASMNVARTFHCAVALNNKIYAIGGRESNQEINSKPKNSCAVYTIEEYDIAADKWTIKTVLPFKHFTVGAVTVNNKIYILSDTINNAMVDESSILEEYDPSTNTFIRKANLKPSKCDAAMTVYNNKIYLFGGWLRGTLSSVEEYDPVTDKWTELENLPYIVQHQQAVTLNNKVHLTGGLTYLSRTENQKKADLILFNPDNQQTNKD